MGIKVTTATGAASWASYFVNCDESGLIDEERALADAWLARQAPWYVVDVERDDDGEAIDPRFTWSFGLHTGADCAGGDVVDYVLHRT